MTPFIQRMTKVHKANYREVVRSLHGNTNRSNVERMLNSYFMYWPISYQLKSAKTLIDVLTNRFGGRQTDLLGLWGYDRIMDQHKERLATDGKYQQWFIDHAEFWRAAGMFLPITPEDLGINASRITRYSMSAAGAAIGLWDKDEDYPDMGTPEGVMDAATRIAQLGPFYSIDLLNRIVKETFKEQ